MPEPFTKNSAIDIAYAWQEIERAHELKAKLQEWIAKPSEDVRDRFDRPRGVQLGIPASEVSTSLYQISPNLALSICDAHIAEMRQKLADVSEKAARAAGYRT